MLQIRDIQTQEELDAYKTVLAKCTGVVSVNGLLNQRLGSVDGEFRTLPIREISMQGSTLINVKGKYVYFNVKAHEAEEMTLARLHGDSIAVGDYYLEVSILNYDTKEGRAYALVIAQPIAVYREDGTLTIIGEFEEMLFDIADIDEMELMDEVMYDIEEELRKEDM